MLLFYLFSLKKIGLILKAGGIVQQVQSSTTKDGLV